MTMSTLVCLFVLMMVLVANAAIFLSLCTNSTVLMLLALVANAAISLSLFMNKHRTMNIHLYLFVLMLGTASADPYAESPSNESPEAFPTCQDGAEDPNCECPDINFPLEKEELDWYLHANFAFTGATAVATVALVCVGIYTFITATKANVIANEANVIAQLAAIEANVIAHAANGIAQAANDIAEGAATKTNVIDQAANIITQTAPNM
jgi:succinate dehydrogenase hydrophobic anchor subunit